MDAKFDVIIIGAGLSGISMALELKDNLDLKWAILEQKVDIGGTWRDNQYPGCGCDVPSILYQLKKRPNFKWTEKYAKQSEILDYLNSLANEINDHIHLNQKVLKIEYKGIDSEWLIYTENQIWITHHLVMSMSPLSKAYIPELPGANKFQGLQFHTSQWDKNVDLKDKKVVVIGSAASAIQCIETIQPWVKELRVIQRSASWIFPKNNKITNNLFKILLTLPTVFPLIYLLNYFLLELKIIFFTHPFLMRLLEKRRVKEIRKKIKDPILQAKLIPNYPMGCKRIILSDHFYEIIQKSNVSLHSHPIKEITTSGIVLSDNSELNADIIIYATGFIHNDHIPVHEVVVPNTSLHNEWDKRRSAYLGIFVPNFPNLYLLVGPNTGLGHQSLLFMVERQTQLIRKIIKFVINHKVKSISVKPKVNHDYQENLDRQSRGTVWQQGCHSWYLNKSNKNVALWPYSSLYYWWKTTLLKKNDFEIRY